MRTTIDLPEDLLRRAEARAALDGTTLKELMARLVEQGLRRLPQATAEAPRERTRSQIPVARPATGEPVPALENRELYRLLDLEDAERGDFG